MKCCVVGCGAAGIISGKHLKDAQIEFDIYEMTDDIGGTWIYTENTKDSFGTPVHTVMYKNLRTNTPKEVMTFEGLDYDMKESFLKPTDIYNYLKNYVNKNELMNNIQLGHVVTNISYQEDKWDVTVNDLRSNTQKKILYDAVMVCNGHHFEPRYPTIQGQDEFTGLQIHSKTYRIPDIFKDKHLLIIGFGPSGQDLAIDTSKKAKVVYVSNHSPKLYKAEFFPSNVVSKPDIERLTRDSVTFKDGSSEYIDAILYCTGFYYTLPFLDETCGITVDDNYVKPLHRQLINITHPTMALMGLPFKTFIFPLFEVQAKAFVKILQGQASLPEKEDMRTELEQFEQNKVEKGIPKRKYHKLDSVRDYIKQLISMSDLEDLPEVLYKIYDHNFDKRKDYLHLYRKYIYTIIDKNNFKVCFEENKDC